MLDSLGLTCRIGGGRLRGGGVEACIDVDRAPSLSSLALVLALAYYSISFVCDLHASLQDRRG